MSNPSPAPCWPVLRRQAEALAHRTPVLRGPLQTAVLDRASFADALAHRLADALQPAVSRGLPLLDVFSSVLANQAAIVDAAQADLHKLADINPACPSMLTGFLSFLSFRGFQALQLHRINHALWTAGDQDLAVLLQNWGAVVFAIDIHPQARVGRAVFLDHGIGLVVGATAVIEDGCNLWHGVTLGSTLTQAGDRHPKLRRGVTVGAGATILGNIEIGECAVVAAGSVVLRAVEPGTVVAGAPAKVVGAARRQLDAIAATPSRLP